MLTFLLLSGCLIETDRYERRRAELLAEADGDTDGDTDTDCARVRVWVDADGDGFGNPDYPDERCAPLDGWVEDATDCDDGDAAVNPDAEEVCATAADDDCDGAVNEDGADGVAVYADADGDGFGDPGAPATLCVASTGWVADATDCDDGDGGVNPGAEEVCGTGVDEDCDEAETECRWEGLVPTDDASARWSGDAASVVGPAVVGDLTADGRMDIAIVGPEVIHLVSDPTPGTWTLGATDYARIILSEGAWSSVTAGGVDAGEARDLAAFARTSDNDIVYLLAGGFSGERVAGGPTPQLLLPRSEGYRPTGALDDGALWIGLPGDGSQSGRVVRVDTDTLPTDVDGAAHTIFGTATDELGYAVGTHDLDGDGVEDLQVCAPGANAGAGAVYTFTGPVIATTPADADAAIVGRNAGDRLGATASWHPYLDVDGDGTTDTAVSAPVAEGIEPRAGAVLILRGPLSDTVDTSSAFATVLGAHPDGQLGISLAANGDVDRDGRDDLLIGRAAADTADARVYLLYGPMLGGKTELDLSHAFIAGSSRTRPSPIAISAGDVDGDGAGDLVLWGEGEASTEVWLFAGAAY